jgi:hypothetical protein
MGHGPDLSTFGGRLERLKQMLVDPDTGEEPSWQGLDRMLGVTPNHMRAVSKKNNCELKVLVALRRETKVNLNWLVSFDQKEIFSPPTKDPPEAPSEIIRQRTQRRTKKRNDDVTSKELAERAPQRTSAAKSHPPVRKVTP